MQPWGMVMTRCLYSNSLQKGVDKLSLTVYSLATSCNASFPMSCTGISSSPPSQIVKRSAGRVCITASIGSGLETTLLVQI